MRFPQGAEWLIILVLILLLFGAKRLPDMARSLGRSARILKTETKGLRDDEGAATDQPALPATTAQQPPLVTPPAAPTVAQPAVPNPAPETAEGQSKPTAS
jgi:sec-independent protein translocase protein TatA